MNCMYSTVWLILLSSIWVGVFWIFLCVWCELLFFRVVGWILQCLFDGWIWSWLMTSLHDDSCGDCPLCILPDWWDVYVQRVQVEALCFIFWKLTIFILKTNTKSVLLTTTSTLWFCTHDCIFLIIYLSKSLEIALILSLSWRLQVGSCIADLSTQGAQWAVRQQHIWYWTVFHGSNPRSRGRCICQGCYS